MGEDGSTNPRLVGVCVPCTMASLIVGIHLGKQMLRLMLRGGLANILILTWLAALTPSAAQAQNPDEADPLLRQVEQLYGEGKYAEALPLAQQSLAAVETKLGSQDPKVGEVLNMLGLLHWNLGQYAEAEPAYRRAIAIGESTPDRDSWVTGARLNNLAILLAGLGARPSSLCSSCGESGFVWLHEQAFPSLED